MTPAELADELEALAAKASPGPVRVVHAVHVFAGSKLVANTGGHTDNFTPDLPAINAANAALFVALINNLPAIAKALRSDRAGALEEASRVCEAEQKEAEAEFQKAMDAGLDGSDFLAEAAMAASCAAAIRALSPLPASCVVVPKEPTEEMVDAATRWFFAYHHMRETDKRNAVANAYRAMLTAAERSK